MVNVIQLAMCANLSYELLPTNVYDDSDAETPACTFSIHDMSNCACIYE